MGTQQGFASRLPSSAEVGFNFWYITDMACRQVLAIVVRGYVVSGTEAEKLSALRRAAVGDYALGEWVQLEARTTLTHPGHPGRSAPGVSLEALQSMGPLMYVNSVVERTCADIFTKFGVRTPAELLSVTTCVEFGDDHSLRSIV